MLKEGCMFCLCLFWFRYVLSYVVEFVYLSIFEFLKRYGILGVLTVSSMSVIGCSRCVRIMWLVFGGVYC